MQYVDWPDGRKVSAIGLGTWASGARDWNDRLRAALRGAIERGKAHGINLVDTAAIYGLGAAESLVSELPLEGGLHVVTKGGLSFEGGCVVRSASPDVLTRDFAASRQRLEPHSIAAFLMHWPGPSPVHACAATLRHLREQAGVQVGASNLDAIQLAAMADAQALDVYQVPVGLGQPPPPAAIMRSLPRETRVMAYGSLSGLDIQHFSDSLSTRVKQVADDHGTQPASVAIRWALQQPGIHHVLVGCTRNEHADAAAQAGELRLPEDDLAFLGGHTP